MSRNIVIAGGSKGIGLELTRLCRASGESVTVLSRTAGQLSVEEQSCWREVDFSTASYSGEGLPDVIHAAVYCPGTINLRSFRTLKPGDFRHDFQVNFMGAVEFLQACLPGLKRSAQETPASVVLFSTVAVQLGMPMHSSIAAAKGAIEGLTRSLAAEWAPSIRVNCIAPALTDTGLAAKLMASPEKRRAMEAVYPLQRVGQPAEIAALARMLLSADAGWMTGQILGVDGGLSAIRCG